MGQLRDLIIPTRSVPVLNGTKALTVRGIAFADAVAIATDHGPAAAMVFQKVVVDRKNVTTDDVKLIVREVLPLAPLMLAAIIALAVDDYSPEGIDTARKLGLNDQLDLLEAIFMLTFTSEAELKKFMESIIRMLAGTKGLVGQIRLPLSEAGFGESAAT